MSVPRALIALGGRLRAAGHAVGPAALITAAQLARQIEPDDREGLRLGLRLTLARSREARAAFDDAFDDVFRTPVGCEPEGKRKGKGKGKRPRPAGEGLRGQPGGQGERQRPPERPQPPRVGKGLPDEPRRRGRREQPQSPPPTDGKPTRWLLERPAAQRARSRSLPAQPSRAELAHAPIEALSSAQLDGEALALARQLRSLRLRRRRRPRRDVSRGALDVQRLLRRSIGREAPPQLPRRRPGRRPPRLLLLIDVSFSCQQTSALLLAGLAELAVDLAGVRCALFVNRPLEASGALQRWWTTRAGAAPRLDDLLDALPELERGAPSDYGRTLEGFQRGWAPWLDRRTVLLVCGDARCNRFDPLPWIAEELGAAVRKLVWLVPEPAERWGTGDSALLQYRPGVDLLAETTTPRGLADAIDELTRLLRS